VLKKRLLLALFCLLESSPQFLVQARPLPSQPARNSPAGQRLNVLLLFSDDQRADTIHALGNDSIETPNLDALVRKGMAFTHTFVTVPVCTPGRAELLSGTSAFRNGVKYFDDKLSPDLTLLPQTFAQAGYLTWFAGKWHNDGTPEAHGFKIARRVFLGGMRAHEMTLKDGQRDVTGFSSELFADAVIDFLSHTPNHPWFAQISFTAPHDPRTPPGRYQSLYDPTKLPLPLNFLPEHPFDNGEMTIRDEQLEKWPRTPDAIRRHLGDYYGMISNLDEQVGRIFKALDSSGQAEKTLVIFASDNGLALGSHGLMGKMSMYDHSVRVPLIISGPGVPRDRRTNALAYLYDVYPTLCELVGIVPRKSLEGLSLAPIMRGEKESVRQEVFGAYMEVQRMVRTERWKLIYYPYLQRLQLFDLMNDPNEMRDLMIPWRWLNTNWYKPSGNLAERNSVVDQLVSKMTAWQLSVRDSRAVLVRH